MKLQKINPIIIMADVADQSKPNNQVSSNTGTEISTTTVERKWCNKKILNVLFVILMALLCFAVGYLAHNVIAFKPSAKMMKPRSMLYKYTFFISII